ncbi:hypothetical protein [Nocardia aurantiaca]|uniref:Uncharacterized protein n=1 Tax=Nocardia aurantiaca TaxID=2675850 RepID=A0A6I3L7C2_9NOCA|nr:hypothetical protein [Nocardia aurantiaca]MTE16415.1 hypothetical protein [Nocardia aurantiaca]
MPRPAGRWLDGPPRDAQDRADPATVPGPGGGTALRGCGHLPPPDRTVPRTLESVQMDGSAPRVAHDPDALQLTAG